MLQINMYNLLLFHSLFLQQSSHFCQIFFFYLTGFGGLPKLLIFIVYDKIGYSWINIMYLLNVFIFIINDCHTASLIWKLFSRYCEVLLQVKATGWFNYITPTRFAVSKMSRRSKFIFTVATWLSLLKYVSLLEDYYTP